MPGYFSYRFAAFVSRRLPLRLAYWVGLRAADAFYLLVRRDRQAVEANLRQVFAGRGIEPARLALRGLTRKTFQYFGKYLVDFFRYARLTPREVADRVSIEHREYLAAAHARGRGVLVVTAHFGNWELGGGVLAALGYRVHAVVQQQRLRRLENLLARQRERRGLHLIPVGAAARGSLRALRAGDLVALLVDRDFTHHRERRAFFGRPAWLPRGAGWLAMKTGAPIVPAFVLRQEDDTFLLRLHRPILPEEEGSAEKIMQRVREVLEQEIGERPHQWFVFHDFWAGEEQAGVS